MRLPPLNAVRAFDAVARLGSVRAAADELAVTPAAVSQQLRVLEAHLGIALVQRQGRGLILTDSGRTWHGEIARHLRAIGLAAERVRPGRRVVQVTVVQSFGSRWLMPRLTKFTAREPEIEVRIDASPALADLARDPFDLAIREGRGDYPEAESTRLFALEFYPMASPAVFRAMRRRNGTLDWSRARLLHEVTYDYWPDWVAMADARDVDVARGLFFSHTMLALDAAIEGQGVALVPPPLAERELARGVLTVVDPRSFIPGTGIYLAWPRRGLRTLSPAATAFRDWVIEEAQATPTAPVAARPAKPRARPATSSSVRRKRDSSRA
jgi:LysR family glycine cleavage system transcriptional activator